MLMSASITAQYALGVIAGLVTELEAGGGEFADNQVPPPDEAARGQLLRLMASDAMRAAVERHYGVRLAFQNCHRSQRCGHVSAIASALPPRQPSALTVMSPFFLVSP